MDNTEVEENTLVKSGNPLVRQEKYNNDENTSAKFMDITEVEENTEEKPDRESEFGNDKLIKKLKADLRQKKK